MKKTNFPTKATFEQDFLNIKNKKLFTLRYEQATIWEYYEYLAKTPEKQTLELYKILDTYIQYNWLERIFKFFNKNYSSKIEKWIEIEEVLTSILKNRYRGYESIFTEVRQYQKWWWPTIESVWLSAICKSYNISPTDLMKNYTLEQYFWFLDGIEWINNSMDKDTEKLNKMALVDKEEVKKRAEETRQAFERIKKSKKDLVN